MKRKWKSLLALGSVFCLLFGLCSCHLLKSTDKTVAWPTDDLPEGFPVLCEEVNQTGVNGDGQFYISVVDPGWDAFHAFVEKLVDAGWGGLPSGYIWSVMTSGDGQMDDETLLRAAIGAAAVFDLPRREEESFVYNGSDGTHRVLCMMAPAERDKKCRFVLYLWDEPAPKIKVFPSLSSQFAIEEGWKTATEEGQLYVTYDYDLTGIDCWAISRDPDGKMTPTQCAQAYREQISESLQVVTFTPFSYTVKGADCIAFAFSFSDGGMEAEYITWQDASGAVWQCTLSATDYDAKMVHAAMTRFLLSMTVETQM